jgi:colicin import membrane protein
MLSMATENDTLNLDIIVNAKGVLETVQDILAAFKTLQGAQGVAGSKIAIDQLQSRIRTFAKEANLNVKDVLATFKMLDKEMGQVAGRKSAIFSEKTDISPKLGWDLVSKGIKQAEAEQANFAAQRKAADNEALNMLKQLQAADNAYWENKQRKANEAARQQQQAERKVARQRQQAEREAARQRQQAEREAAKEAAKQPIPIPSPIRNILSNVNKLNFGDVSQYSDNVAILKTQISALAKEMGVNFVTAANAVKKALPIVPIKAITDATKLYNKELSGTATAAERAEEALRKFMASSKGQAAGGGIGGLNFGNPQEYVANVKSLMSSIKSISSETGASVQQVGKYISEMFTNIPKPALNEALENIGREVSGLPLKFEKGGSALQAFGKELKALLNPVNMLRTAFGTLTAVLVFSAIQAVRQFFTEALEYAKNFEKQLRELKLAEKFLSQAGMEISGKQFEEMVDRLSEKYKFIKKSDIRETIAQVSMLTTNLGLSGKELEKFIDSVVYAMQLRPDKSAEEVVGEMTRGWLDRNSKVLNNYNIILDDNRMKQKAMEMGLVDSNEALDENAKIISSLELIYEQTGARGDDLTESIEGTNAAIDAQTAIAEENAIAKVADDVRAADLWFKNFKITVLGLWDAFSDGTGFVSLLGDAFRFMWASFLTGVTGAILAFDVLLGKLDGKDFYAAWEDATGQIYQEIFRYAQTPFAEQLRNAGIIAPYEPLPSQLDFDEQTGSGAGDGIDKMGESADKVQKEIERLQEALRDLDDKEKETRDKFERDWGGAEKIIDWQQTLDVDTASKLFERLGREVQDFIIDMKRKEEDYQRSVADVIRDFANRKADLERKYRDNQKNEEAKFQEELRQLRERYLFDLEDALANRDARQVLQLMKKYQMDKQNMINEYNLQRKEQQRQYKQELKDLQAQKAAKLREMAEEHKIRMQRELEDWIRRREQQKLEFQRELQDIAEQRKRKIEEAAAAINDELGLKNAGAKALYILLKSYYGPGGLFDQLYNYSADSMVASAQNALEQIRRLQELHQSQTGTGGSSTIPNSSGSPDDRDERSIGRRAGGGTFFADRPTHAIFGDVPEIATFTPISRLGKMPTPVGAGGFGGGTVGIELFLSPDLEYRIRENTLDSVANVVARIVRSK